ncbi:MAG: hypothetical protein KGS48_07800, partial [Bacteroidetes bacterium]|nr:hypothetical protein [Bacteroidota bacterium]
MKMIQFDLQTILNKKWNAFQKPVVLALMVVFAFLTAGLSRVQAQLTGTKTIPGTYATLTAAITDLNTQGVGAGGVTFNIAAGYTETLSGRLDITATGTAANPIIFQKNGAGANPVLTSYTGIATATSAAMDGMIALIGSDYVTFNGIDL